MAIAPPLANIARLISRAEYGRMIDAGLFAGERVELWKGVVVRMCPQRSPHAAAVQKLNHLFVLALVATERAFVRVQLPLALSEDSEPEPDIAVVEPRDFRDEHPTTAHLIIEVADTSLADDRGFKAEEYAAAGIVDYWVVDVQGRTIEVHRDPSPRGYRKRTLHQRGATCTPLAFSDLTIAVTDVVG
jgi:Uma2 family endonuclease